MTRFIRQNLVLVVVAFTKKKKKKSKTASKTNTHWSSSEYCSVRSRIILILCFVYNNIIHVVKYESDEYFKLWIWVFIISSSNHWKYVWFIRLLIQIYKFRKTLIILINDSNDSIYSSKFSLSCCCIYKKK